MTTLDKMQSELSDMAAAVDARFQQDASTIATLLDGLKRLGGITTCRICPPIGVRGFDWSAVLDDYDGAPDSKQPIGYGPTELAAVLDLLGQQD